MKINKLTIILIIIIILLSAYIVYDKLAQTKLGSENTTNENVTLKETISLDYVNIYLLSNGDSYIAPINEEEIAVLDIKDKLKERLNTLYTRAFYFDVYINNYKLKGFKVKLDSNITNIEKIEINNYVYVVFVKENNTIGVFDYLNYYDLLDTQVIDNYQDLKNVSDIKKNKIIFLDGSSKEFIIEK